MLSGDAVANLEAFQDSLSTTVIARLAPAPAKGSKRRAVKGRKKEIKPVSQVAAGASAEAEQSGAGDLSDFIQVRYDQSSAAKMLIVDGQFLAAEIFVSLPAELRTLSYPVIQDDAAIKQKYDLPIDSALLESVVHGLQPATADSLTTYSLISQEADLDRFLEPVLENYIATVTAPPPEYTPAILAARPLGCEICGREHLPLTYHHLIPRQKHAMAIKRGWHKEWELNKVAWLCRACHSYVHTIASNEELAKEVYSVEALMGREDVQKWANWVGRIRWKAR